PRIQALRLLGHELAKAQLLERAKEVWAEAVAEVQAIDDDPSRAEGLIELGHEFAQAQQWEQANSLWTEAERIISNSTDITREDTLAKLSHVLAKAHQWDRAQTLARTLRSDDARAMALCKLVCELCKARLLDQANAVWLEARSLLNPTGKGLYY